MALLWCEMLQVDVTSWHNAAPVADRQGWEAGICIQGMQTAGRLAPLQKPLSASWKGIGTAGETPFNGKHPARYQGPAGKVIVLAARRAGRPQLSYIYCCSNVDVINLKGAQAPRAAR